MVGFLSNLKAHARFLPVPGVFDLLCDGEFLMVPQSAHAFCACNLAQPVSHAVLPGSNATFIVKAATPPLAYQWRFNAAMCLERQCNRSPSPTSQSANTARYSVVITNASGVVNKFACDLALATAPDFLWARTVTNGVSPNYAGYTYAGDVAADNEGNVFVAGMFGSRDSTLASIDFGGGVLTNNSPTNNAGLDQRHILSPSTTISATSPGRGRSHNSIDSSRMRLVTDMGGNGVSRDNSRELHLRNQYADEFGHARYLPGQVQFSG